MILHLNKSGNSKTHKVSFPMDLIVEEDSFCK